MTKALAIAQSRILDPAGLARTDLDKLFSQLMAPAVDYADIYF